jgi:hypothetical protein
MSRLLLRASCAAAALLAGGPAAFAQSNNQLPTIDVLAQGGTLTVPTFEQAPAIEQKVLRWERLR